MKKFIIAVLAVIAIVAAPSLGNAFNLTNLSKVNIELVDEVTGRCWVNTANAKFYVEKELLSAGVVSIDEGKDPQALLDMRSFGMKDKNGTCFVHYELKVIVLAYKQDKTWGDPNEPTLAFVYRKHDLTIGLPEYTSKEIHDGFRGWAAELALKINKDNGKK
jgi:hypothetical protein